ncbi:MAG: hypothetical protein EAZ36_06730 [Verrucomicrobia bacterium]|nr:MAG: hypothetical protein EAZ36_06730 [Verrucomicrobiota bacterium]
MADQTFSELYCKQHGISPEFYARSILNETLYPHARLVQNLVRLFAPEYFALDLEFVNHVAALRRYRDFFPEANAFSQHPDNSGLLRTRLNLRVSSRRMRRLVRSILCSETDTTESSDPASTAPFSGTRNPSG